MSQLMKVETEPCPTLGNALLRSGMRARLAFGTGTLAGLILALYWNVLRGLADDWRSNPDNSHGFLVPLFSAYVIWDRREKYLGLPLAPSNSGLPAIAASIALLVAGTLGAELFTTRVSFIALLAGVGALFMGWASVRALALPLVYLGFMFPIPAIIQNQIVFPLQLVASRLAATILEAAGIVVLREGNLLRMGKGTLEVAQACSGIRSLVAMFALCVAFGYLAENRQWVRNVLLLLVAPIAILSNALRVVATGVLTQFAGPEWAEGSVHEFSGLLVMSIALLFLLLCDRVLRRLAPPAKGGVRV